MTIAKLSDKIPAKISFFEPNFATSAPKNRLTIAVAIYLQLSPIETRLRSTPSAFAISSGKSDFV